VVETARRREGSQSEVIRRVRYECPKISAVRARSRLELKVADGRSFRDPIRKFGVLRILSKSRVRTVGAGPERELILSFLAGSSREHELDTSAVAGLIYLRSIVRCLDAVNVEVLIDVAALAAVFCSCGNRDCAAEQCARW